MNKKTFLCTTIASTMIIAGITFPMSNAAVEKTLKHSFNQVDSKNVVTIQLDNSKDTLTKKNIDEIFAQNEHFTIKEIKNVDGTVASEDSTAVGTGATVTLTTNKTFTIELFGDVNGNGKIDSDDGQRAFDKAFGDDNGVTNSADIIGAETKIDSEDAQKLYDLAYADSDKGTADYVEAAKMPEDKVDEVKVLDFAGATVSTVASSSTADNQQYIQAANVTTEDGKIILEVEALLGKMQEIEKPQAAYTEKDSAIPATVSETNETTAKWYGIKLNTGITDWEIAESENYTVTVDEKDNQPIIWLVATEDGAETAVTVSNKLDTTEKVDVIIRLVDAQNPTAVKVENDSIESRNRNRVSNVALSNKTVTVTRNANKMEYKKLDENGEEKRWYALEITTDMLGEKVTAIDCDNNFAELKTEPVTGEGNQNKVKIYFDAERPTTTIRLINKNKIKNINTETNSDYIGTLDKLTITTKDDNNVKLSLNQAVLATGIGSATNSGEGTEGNWNIDNNAVQLIAKKSIWNGLIDLNQSWIWNGTVGVTDAVTSNKPVVAPSANTINISGNKEAMHTFVLDTENGYQVKTTENGELVSGGRKYYAIVLDYAKAYGDIECSGTNGSIVVPLGGDADTKQYTYKYNEDLTSKKLKDVFYNATSFGKYSLSGLTSTNGILVFLDANEPETTITIKQKSTTTVAVNDYLEEMKIKVNFNDISNVQKDKISVSAVTNTSNENVNNNGKAISKLETKVNASKFETHNAGSTTVTANVKVASTKELDENGNRYYALRVKTGVNRNLLQVEYPTTKTIVKGSEMAELYKDLGLTLAEDEIIVWVNSGLATANYTITNINDKLNNKYTLTVKNTDASDISLNKAKGVQVVTAKAENVEKIKTAVGGEENYDTLLNNIEVTSKAIADNKVVTGTGIVNTNYEKTFKISTCSDLLKSFNLYGVSGKWVPIKIELNENTANIKGGWTDNNKIAYIDNENKAYFEDISSSTTGDEILIWVNIDKDTSENGKVVANRKIDITKNATGNEVAESIIVRIQVNNMSTTTNTIPSQTEEKLKPNTSGSNGTGYHVESGDDTNFKQNMNAIDSINMDSETNTITVKADIKSMTTYKPTVGEAKSQDRLYFALKVNLGIKRNELFEKDDKGNYTQVNDDAKDLATEWGITDNNTFVQWVGFTKEEIEAGKVGSEWKTGDKMTRTVTLYRKIRVGTGAEVYEPHTFTIVLEQI